MELTSVLLLQNCSFFREMSESSITSVESAHELDQRKRGYSADKEVVLAWKDLTVSVPKKVPKRKWWNQQKTENQIILDNGKFLIYLT